MLRLAASAATVLGVFVALFVVVLSGAPPAAGGGAPTPPVGGPPVDVQPGNPLAGCPHPPVTQPFGPSQLPGEPAVFGFAHFHTGIDLACPYGTPVHDVGGPGVARVQFGNTGFGNNVVVRVATTNGIWFVRYAHLAAIAVADGDQVAVGELLGWEGSTGYSTGPHLHFETDLGAASVAAAHDPSRWLTL
jgi:murein DD-endopeptidase MepM/ murein hydrolase activator NlpD